MKNNLIILGAGPRGIACAIQALKYKDLLNIYLIDNNPVSTWQFPNMVIDMEMRSPITFDLVTYQQDLQEYSLSNYLGYNTKPVFTQKEIEANNIFCKRIEFVNYLKDCIKRIKFEGVEVIKQKVISVSKEEIIFTTGRIKYKHLIIATGKETEAPVIPVYLANKNICFCEDLYTVDWTKYTPCVVGSGQFAAEMVDYLSDNYNKTIYWARNHNVKVEQYPVPSFKQWKNFSALSLHYYKNLGTLQTKLAYINKVKDWSPSITPHINNKLEKKNNQIKYIKSEDIKTKNNKFLLAVGKRQDLYKLPFTFGFKLSQLPNKIPSLNKNFASSTPNIYFTGLLAMHTGGPQQGSIISSGETARIILKSIASS